MDWTGNPLTPGGSERDPLQVEIEAARYKRNDAIARVVSLRLVLEGVFGAAKQEELRLAHQTYVDLMAIEGRSIRAATALTLSREWGKVFRRSLVVFCQFAALALAAGGIYATVLFSTT